MWRQPFPNSNQGVDNAQHKFKQMRKNFSEMKKETTWTSTFAFLSFFLIVIFIILLVIDYITGARVLNIVNKKVTSPSFDTINIASKGSFKDIDSSGKASLNTVSSTKGIFTDIESSGNATFKDMSSSGNASFNNVFSSNINSTNSMFTKDLTAVNLTSTGSVKILGPIEAESVLAKNFGSKGTLNINAPIVNIDTVTSKKAAIQNISTNKLDAIDMIVSNTLKVDGDTFTLTGKATDQSSYDDRNAYRALSKNRNTLLLNKEGDYEDGVQVDGKGLYVSKELVATQGKIKNGLGPYMIQLSQDGTTQCVDASMFNMDDKGVNQCDSTSLTQKWYYDPIKKKIFNPEKNQCIRAGSAAWTIKECQDSELEQVMNFTVNDLIYNRETETCFDMSSNTRQKPCYGTDKGTKTQRVLFVDPSSV